MCVSTVVQITNKTTNDNKDNHHINSRVRMELIIVNINATPSHKFI